MVRTTHSISTGALGPVVFDVYKAVSKSPRPAILLLHGFKGFRQWGFLPEAARRFADGGFHVIAIDLSGNGMRGTDDQVIDTDAFRNQTISADIHDVTQVLTWMLAHANDASVLDGQWDGSVHLVGHSRGGALSLIIARQLVESPTKICLHRIVLWNSIGTLVRWTPRQRAVWESDQQITVENARTGQKLAMGFQYVTDIERNETTFDLAAATTCLANRVVFIHAEQDVTASLKEITPLVSITGRSDALVVIPNTGHTFGIQHPFQGATKAFEDVMNATLQWLLHE